MNAPMLQHLAKPVRRPDLLRSWARTLWRIQCPQCGDLGVTVYTPEEAADVATHHYHAQLRKAPRPIR